MQFLASIFRIARCNLKLGKQVKALNNEFIDDFNCDDNNSWINLPLSQQPLRELLAASKRKTIEIYLLAHEVKSEVEGTEKQ